MNVSLSPHMQKFAEQKIREGKYASVDELIEASLASLEVHEAAGDIPPGVLDQLLAEGEADAAAGDLHDGQAVFREIDQLSAARRRDSQT